MKLSRLLMLAAFALLPQVAASGPTKPNEGLWFVLEVEAPDAEYRFFVVCKSFSRQVAMQVADDYRDDGFAAHAIPAEALDHLMDMGLVYPNENYKYHLCF